MNKSLIISLILLFAFPRLDGQFLNTIPFSKDEIKVSSGIVGLYEDKKAYLWVYGHDGISRYNGHYFERIEDLFPSCYSLSSFDCSAFSKSKDYIWFAINDHDIYLVDNQGNLLSFHDLLSDMSQMNSTNFIQIETIGKFVFLLGDQGLESFKKSGSKYKSFNLPIDNPQDANSIALGDDHLWVSTENALYRIDLIDLSVIKYDDLHNPNLFKGIDEELWLAHIPDGTEIRYFDTTKEAFIVTDYQPYKNYKNKRVFQWIGKDKLLSSPEYEMFLEVAHFDTEKREHINEQLSGLEDNRFIGTPFRDSKGQVWLYDEELFLIPNHSFIKAVYHSEENEIINDLVVKADLMYTSIRNKGLYVFNQEGKKLSVFNTSNSEIADNFVSSIVDLGSGRLGLCLMNFFQVYDINKGFEKPIPMPGISRSAFENDRFIWIGGNKGVFKFDKSTQQTDRIKLPKSYLNEGIPFNAILKLDTSLYLVSANEGTYEIDLQNDSVHIVQHMWELLNSKWRFVKYNDASLSPTKNIIALASNNGLWIDRLDEKNEIFGSKKKKINTGFHYFSNVVFKNDSILYATTKDKIVRININDGSVLSFGQFQGVLNRTFTLRSSYRDDQGRIYFGGDRGIDRIDGDELKPPLSKSKLDIDQIYHNGIPQFPAFSSDHRVPPDVKILEMKVNQPGNILSKPSVIQSRFSEHPNWTNLSENNIFTVYNPNPGKMNLEFRALDENGNVLSVPLSLEVKVLQEWYRKSWVWMLFGLSMFSIFTLFYLQYQNRKNDRIKKEAELHEELALLKLNALNAQMNPHFIFNALSSIKQLIASGESEVAEEYLSKFSKLLRHVIQYASYQNVSLDQEISFIENYLDLELLRFENAFDYHIHCTIKNPHNIRIPPFFIQPQIENAIKHGILNNGKKGEIKVNIEQVEKDIVITIEDNGKGRHASSSKNIYTQTNTKKGNLLTKERIENLNKLNYRSHFEIEDLYENDHPVGTKTTLIFENEAL